MTGPVHVVTAFICHGGRVLLLRRSRRVGSYPGRWAGVSGYLEDRPPLDQALREIDEETGIGAMQLHLVGVGDPLEVVDSALCRVWSVHPFLFEAEELPLVTLDWEHDGYRWVRPTEVELLQTVPRLGDALKACGVAPTRVDAEPSGE
jgi:8-oxo-dGTP pyrophosphatase MutT (NUDIX family)